MESMNDQTLDENTEDPNEEMNITCRCLGPRE